MVLAIRSYQPCDLEACRRLWEQLNTHHREIYRDPAIGGADPGRYFDDHLAKIGPERIWVAQSDGTICGMAGLIVEGDEGEIEPVIVAPPLRDQGVGEKLLEHVIGEARKAGIRFLSVAPVARNKDAIAFFARHGFRTVGRVELFQELSPSSRAWEDGVVLHGAPFRH